ASGRKPTKALPLQGGGMSGQRGLRRQRRSRQHKKNPPAEPAGDPPNVGSRQNRTLNSPSPVLESPLKLANVTRRAKAYSRPKSTNATGLQNRLACAIPSALLLVVFGPTMLVLTADQKPLASIVERSSSFHQCWYQR